MTLRQIINDLETFPDELTIYATRTEQWIPDGPAALVRESDAAKLGIEMKELRYFLEVDIAREVLKVLNARRDRIPPTQEEKIEAVVYYASNDAYIS